MSDRGIKRDSPLFEPQDGSDHESGRSNHKRIRSESTQLTSRSSPASSLSAGSHTPSKLFSGRVPPYDVRTQERRPPLAIYSPSFRKAENCIVQVIKQFLAVHDKIKIDGYDNKAVARVCAELGTFLDTSAHYKTIAPVACLGPAGVGKSSTINSILSQESAAPEHNGDERGTYVVHEYLGPLSTQVTPYLVEVPFRPLKTITLSVIRHQDSISKAQLSEEELDDDVEEDLEQKSQTGLEFFHNLLCDHRDFRTLEDVSAFFEDNKDDPKGATDVIMERIVDFMGSRDICNEQEVYECIDERALNEVFKKVSRPFRTRGNMKKVPSPWPLVSKVRVRQNLDLLKSGLVLADTPGLNDTNLTVVENTTSYIKDADSILVFASIKRISENKALDQSLRDCILLGKAQNIYLVVTMIDDKQTFNDYERDGLEQSDLDAILAKEADIANFRSQTRDLEAGKRIEQDNDRFRALDVELDSLARKIAVKDAELKQLVVEIHCNAVRTKLKGKLQQLTKSKSAPELKVLFISNTQYQKHVSGYEAAALPALCVDATGVPALRQLLYRIPARGKFETLRMIAKHRVPHCIKGIHGIINKSTFERKQEVGKEIAQRLRLFDAFIPGVVKSILRSFKKEVNSEIEKNHEKWSEKGEKLAKSWEKTVKFSTFAAFCRKGGFWKLPRTKSMISWNAMICDISNAKLGAAFDSLKYEVDGEVALCAEKLASVFSAFKTTIATSPPAQGMDLYAFFSIVDDIKAELMEDMEEYTDELQKIFANVHAAMTVDGKDNFCAEAMKDTYDACVLHSSESFGKLDIPHKAVLKSNRRRLSKKQTPHAKRVETISNKLSGKGEESVFRTMYKKAERNLGLQLQEWEAGMQQVIRSGCEKIMLDFDERYQQEEEGEVEEQDPVVVERLQEAMKVALGHLDGELMDYIEECEAYEKDAA